MKPEDKKLFELRMTMTESDRKLFDNVRFLVNLSCFDITGRIDRGDPPYVAIAYSKAMVKSFADSSVMPLLEKFS